MIAAVNWRKIGLFILLSYGISWLVASALWVAGMGLDSPSGVAIIAVFYMGGPAIATFIIQRFIYKQGFREYGWSFDRRALRWLLVTPLVFLLFSLLTFAIIWLCGNVLNISGFGHIDLSYDSFMTQLLALLEGGPKGSARIPSLPNLPPVMLFAVMILSGIVSGSTIAIPIMFGEEFGWRGLLLRETLPMGFVRSSIFIGLVWGLWHLPLILMGLNYPHYPWWGVGMMCLATVALSPIFSWVRLRTRSILGPCMLHGMINATAGMLLLYVVGGSELIASLVGVAGVLAAILVTVAIVVFDKKFIRSAHVMAPKQG